MAMSVVKRVKKYRDQQRKSGLRLVQLWVPDTKKSGFTEECRRQSLLAAKADVVNDELLNLMDEALQDVDGWTV